MKMNKDRRHYFIKKVITENEVETQEQLLEMLNEIGMQVTQATISRDIRELNLVKIPLQSGKFKYSFVMDTDFEANYLNLLKKLNEVLIKIDIIENKIILKTIPGNAHVLGVILDGLEWEEMVGCVCGNDTCLVITKTKKDANIIYKRMIKVG